MFKNYVDQTLTPSSRWWTILHKRLINRTKWTFHEPSPLDPCNFWTPPSLLRVKMFKQNRTTNRFGLEMVKKHNVQKKKTECCQAHDLRFSRLMPPTLQFKVTVVTYNSYWLPVQCWVRYFTKLISIEQWQSIETLQ